MHFLCLPQPYLPLPRVNNVCTRLVIHAFVISNPDYCGALCVQLSLNIVQEHQLIQDMAVKLLTRIKQTEQTILLLRDPAWPPVCFLARFQVI